MPFKARNNGSWVDASAVYGQSGGSWLYGKSAWAKKDGTWQRSWTDCRRHDEGGRDWTTSTSCAECVETITDTAGCDSCGSRTGTRTRTRYTKDGCTTYYSDWSAYSYGACTGSWSSAPANWSTVTSLTVGSFPYVIFSLYYGQWLYTDSTGTVFVSCTGGYYGPGDVQVCSLTGLYRAVGADICRI